MTSHHPLLTSQVAVGWRDKTGNVRTTQYWGAFVRPLWQWKSSKYCTAWACVCSLRYPACQARTPYCVYILGLSGCTVLFPHYLINGAIFGGMLLNTKCVFWFSLQLSLTETSLCGAWLYMLQNHAAIINVSACNGSWRWLYSALWRDLIKQQIEQIRWIWPLEGLFNFMAINQSTCHPAIHHERVYHVDEQKGCVTVADWQ
jgi:hypothetical protein